MRYVRPGCLVLAFLWLANSLVAQTVSGAINGTITDPSGAVIGSVQVEITNPETVLEIGRASCRERVSKQV